MDLQVRFEPRPNYARAMPRLVAWGARLGVHLERRTLPSSRRHALELAADGKALIGRIRMKAGERAYLSLCYSKADIGVIAPLGEAADDRLRSTLKWWTAWSSRCAYKGPHREAVLRSAITLKLMTFALSGAVIAAPTTSLPEASGRPELGLPLLLASRRGPDHAGLHGSWLP